MCFSLKKMSCASFFASKISSSYILYFKSYTKLMTDPLRRRTQGLLVQVENHLHSPKSTLSPYFKSLNMLLHMFMPILKLMLICRLRDALHVLLMTFKMVDSASNKGMM